MGIYANVKISNMLNKTDNIIHPVTYIHIKPQNRGLPISNCLNIFFQSVHNSVNPKQEYRQCSKYPKLY